MRHFVSFSDGKSSRFARRWMAGTKEVLHAAIWAQTQVQGQAGKELTALAKKTGRLHPFWLNPLSPCPLGKFSKPRQHALRPKVLTARTSSH